MNKIIKKETVFAGKKLVLETGGFAMRANMAVKATYGDSVIIVAIASGDSDPEKNFFPLMVQYEEKLYASGSIKSSRFMKRDGKPTDDAVVARRAIDHAIRPLFPKDYMDQIQVIVTVLSLDEQADVEFLSMVGASACLHASDVPFHGPMTSTKVGLVEDKFVFNPSREDLHNGSKLDMLVSFVGKDQKFLAVEAEANVVPDKKIIEAIHFARKGVKPVLDLITDFGKEVNPKGTKYAYESKALSEDLLKDVSSLVKDKIDQTYRDDLSQNEIDDIQDDIKEQVLTKLEGKYKKISMLLAINHLEKLSIKELVLKEGKRLDGRAVTDVRSIVSEVGFLPRVHGSGLFTRGNTQALTVATLGSPSQEILIQDMYGERSKRFMHYYDFPAYSVGEVGRYGFPKGREIGHGMIAERALKAVIPSQNEFPYTIIAVSEILSSNGSSSMAAVCGSSLALMDAGVPVKDMVAGIAMGLIVEDESFSDYKVLTDLSGEEDGGGYLDFKMAGTKDGVTAIQCDMKVKGLPMEILEKVITQSREGRLFILDEMKKTISSPRESLSKYAPKTASTKIDPSKIGLVIGGGGRTIKEIQEKTNSDVFIEEDGTVVVSSSSVDDTQEAIDIVSGLVREIKPGEVYDGVVEELLDFGALVKILPGKVGLLHISEVADKYVEDINKWFKIGDSVKVKVLRVERDGKMSLSKKALEKSSDDTQQKKR